MGLFDFLKAPDINAGVADFKDTTGAVLVDVRTPDEYADGHIPGSINIPVEMISTVENKLDKKQTVFTYCYSGARSARAAAALKDMGFADVRNIGGIAGYRGKVER